MDDRATFKEVSYNNTKLQIVSLGTDLIEKLKSLTTHEAMFDFVAKQGLAWNNVRISESVKAEALVAIWNGTDMQSDKNDIVDAICALSDIGSVLSDKLKGEKDLEEKELAAMQKEEDDANIVKQQLKDNPNIDIHQMAEDNATEANL